MRRPSGVTAHPTTSQVCPDFISGSATHLFDGHSTNTLGRGLRRLYPARANPRIDQYVGMHETEAMSRPRFDFAVLTYGARDRAGPNTWSIASFAVLHLRLASWNLSATRSTRPENPARRDDLSPGGCLSAG